VSFNFSERNVDTDFEILPRGSYTAYAARLSVFKSEELEEDVDAMLPSIYITLLINGREIQGCWMAPVRPDDATDEDYKTTCDKYLTRIAHLLNALKVPQDKRIFEFGSDLVDLAETRTIRVEVAPRYIPVLFEDRVVTKAIYQDRVGDRPLKRDQVWIGKDQKARLFRLCRAKNNRPLYKIQRCFPIQEQ